jgi:hypothetical protein
MLYLATAFLVSAFGAAMVGVGSTASELGYLAQTAFFVLLGLFIASLAIEAWNAGRQTRKHEAQQSVSAFVRRRQQEWVRSHKAHHAA